MTCVRQPIRGLCSENDLREYLLLLNKFFFPFFFSVFTESLENVKKYKEEKKIPRKLITQLYTVTTNINVLLHSYLLFTYLCQNWDHIFVSHIFIVEKVIARCVIIVVLLLDTVWGIEGCGELY